MRTMTRLLAGLLPILACELAVADAPEIVITNPVSGSTVYVNSFPYLESVDFTAFHDPISPIKDLDVTVNGLSLTGFPLSGGSVFAGGVCSDALITASTSCSIASDTATVSVPWEVPAPGSFLIQVSAKHGNNEGSDAVSADYILNQVVSVEYPAPPAVANAYLNSTGAKVNAKQRGCIVSTVAENHAKDSKYGPKGGPYNTALIQSDTSALKLSCPSK